MRMTYLLYHPTTFDVLGTASIDDKVSTSIFGSSFVDTASIKNFKAVENIFDMKYNPSSKTLYPKPHAAQQSWWQKFFARGGKK